MPSLPRHPSALISGARPSRCLGSRRIPGHVRLRLTRFVGRFPSHLNARAESRVSLASAEAVALPQKGSHAERECLRISRRSVLAGPHWVSWLGAASQFRRSPPLWCFCCGCTGHSASRPMSREFSSTRLLDASARPRAARDPGQAAMTSSDRAPHESASPVASNGTESDGEVRT